MFTDIEKTIGIVVIIVAAILAIWVILKYVLPVIGNSNTKTVRIIVDSKSPIIHFKNLTKALTATSAGYLLYHYFDPNPESLPLLIAATVISIILIFIRSLLIREQTYNFGRKLQLIELTREIQIFIFDLTNNRVGNHHQTIRSILVKYDFDELSLPKIYDKLVDIYSDINVENEDIRTKLINTLNHNILDNHPDLRIQVFNPEL